MQNITFIETENNVVMSFGLGLFIPKKLGKGADGDIDSFKFARMIDIIGAFSTRIIASLERRMQACQQNLITHLEDIEYNDGMHICWHRKDGTSGNFNIPSFNAMRDCIRALHQSNFADFCKKRGWIDQTLKALLNDTEQDHSDMCGFRYSELVSILCELQACSLD